MNDVRRQLQHLIRGPGLTATLAAHDAFTARVLEQAGMKLLFVGGFGVSASRLGLPDLGLLTLTEMVESARSICRSVSIPVVVDGDTGHGGPANIRRTVREFEDLGAAGMLIEDQANPKRCGHFSGQQIVSPAEMRARLQTALDARRNSEFAIFARTDARSVDGLNAAIDRACSFGEQGADVCFIEAPRSREEVQQIAAEVPYPLLANMLTDGRTPILNSQELAGLGYRFSVCPVAALMGQTMMLLKLAGALQEHGSLETMRQELVPFEELKKRLGLDDVENQPFLSNHATQAD